MCMHANVLQAFACVRASCVRACVRVCLRLVRACVHACFMHACVRVCFRRGRACVLHVCVHASCGRAGVGMLVDGVCERAKMRTEGA